MKREDLLIDCNQLVDQLYEPNVRIVDCRWNLTDPTVGLTEHNLNHIPTAQFVPLEPSMSANNPSKGRHPLPEPAEFADVLSELGISNQSQVVVYDDGSSVYACRFWWMCRWLGHAQVKVLDGGYHQWQSSALPTSTELPQPDKAIFTCGRSLTRQVSAEEVQGSSATLLDARSIDRFEGRVEPIDHTSGHIPGALCFPFDENLNDEKEFRRDSTRFDDLNQGEDVICYCGSGVSATQNILALLLAGYSEPILYPGSWSEWIEDSSRPIATV